MNREEVNAENEALPDQRSAGPRRVSSRPDLVIPCRVARQQSPAPFHQPKIIISAAQKARKGLVRAILSAPNENAYEPRSAREGKIIGGKMILF
jgi:hypothetical protein